MHMTIRRVLSKAITTNCVRCLIVTASWFYSLPCNAENCSTAPVTGKVYFIINQASGMALDISHESHTLGANAIQWPYKATSNHKFVLSDLSNGFWSLHAVRSGLVLDLEHASVEPGGNILQWHIAYSGQT
jgi:hypothetical protein